VREIQREVKFAKRLLKEVGMDISIITPINSLGYGKAGVQTVDALVTQGHEVSLFPMGKIECHPRFNNSIRNCLHNAETFSVNAPCIRIWHQHDMSMFVGKHVHIGFPIFELDTFTSKEKHHLRSCDCIYVCSEWAKEIVNNNIKPWELTTRYQHPTTVRVVPLGVDTSVFTPKKSTRKPTIFLNVGKWEVRKGHDILVDIFNYAFTEDDNVELWMMCDNPFLNQEKQQLWINRYKNSKLGSKIRLIPRVESDIDVANIMQQADCGVFPSRAEGWNLELLEMMSCG
jgi:glycosyltransferase involved in cell wall biosynthesis